MYVLVCPQAKVVKLTLTPYFLIIQCVLTSFG